MVSRSETIIQERRNKEMAGGKRIRVDLPIGAACYALISGP